MKKRTTTAVWVESARRWQLIVQKDGVRRTFTSSKPGRTGQRECNAKADAWLDDGIEEQSRRVNDLFAAWYASVKASTSEGNWRPLESRWRVHILPVLGQKRLDKISEGQWQDVINALYAEGASKKSLQNYCADIRAFYKWCRAHRYTAERLETLRPPKGARVGQRTILQPDDLRTLFSSDSSTWWQKPCIDPLVRAYRFQVAAGLRPGELIGLRWTDIDGFRGAHTDWDALPGTLVRIQRSVNTKGTVTEGKNENAVRSFVLFPLLAQILKEQYAFTGREKQVFPISAEHVYYQAWVRYCKANGLRQVSLYELRHTFVSVVKTLPAGEVKPWVGHSRNMDTFGVYAHALSDDAARVSRDFGALYDRLLGG